MLGKRGFTGELLVFLESAWQPVSRWLLIKGRGTCKQVCSVKQCVHQPIRQVEQLYLLGTDWASHQRAGLGSRPQLLALSGLLHVAHL